MDGVTQPHGVTQGNICFQAAASNAVDSVTVSARTETCFSALGALKCAARGVRSSASSACSLDELEKKNLANAQIRLSEMFQVVSKILWFSKK
jgi:hypothetical protein